MHTSGICLSFYLEEEVDLLQFLLYLLAGFFLCLTSVLVHLALVCLGDLHSPSQRQHLLLQLPLASLQLVAATAQTFQGGDLILELLVDLLQLVPTRCLLLQLSLQIINLKTERMFESQEAR